MGAAVNRAVDSRAGRDVCVVIPAFNRPVELSRALDSLTAQTDSNFEVVVCDDGSSEPIGPLVDTYRSNLDVSHLRIANSGGPARPRNQAMAVTRAEWISFLDSDDWWYPSRMEKLRPCLGSQVDIVYHPLAVHCNSDSTGRSASGAASHGGHVGLPMRGQDMLMQMLRYGNPLATSGTTVRTATILGVGGFDESRELSSVEDFDAWLRLAASGARFAFLDEPLGAYWVGEDNISTFGLRQFERQRALFARQLGLLPPSYRASARSNFNYLLGSYALRLGLPEAARHLRQVSLMTEPVRWCKARAKLLLRATLAARTTP